MSESWVLAKYARRGLVLIALIVFGLGAASLRTLLAGQQALVDAERAFDEGELIESIRHARRAASLSVPGGSHVQAAYDRLLVIARGAEALGRSDLSLAAWEAVRASALDSGSLLAPPRPDLERANQNLARLRARMLADPPAGEPSAAVERESLRALERPAAPRRSALFAVAFGFVLSVLGLGFAGLRGVSADARVQVRKLALGLALFVIGAACWTWAVYGA